MPEESNPTMPSPAHDHDDSGEIDHPEISGKIVILTILGLALLATGYAWWYQRQRGQQILDFWGAETAFAIRHAKEIELIRLDAGDDEAISLGEARGLIHARQALIVDASYDWESVANDVTPKWQYALRFSDEEKQTESSLWFDLDQELAGNQSGDHCVKIHIAEGLRKFFEEQVAESDNSDESQESSANEPVGAEP